MKADSLAARRRPAKYKGTLTKGHGIKHNDATLLLSFATIVVFLCCMSNHSCLRRMSRFKFMSSFYVPQLSSFASMHACNATNASVVVTL